jgi:hypothetical protein
MDIEAFGLVRGLSLGRYWAKERVGLERSLTFASLARGLKEGTEGRGRIR